MSLQVSAKNQNDSIRSRVIAITLMTFAMETSIDILLPTKHHLTVVLEPKPVSSVEASEVTSLPT